MITITNTQVKSLERAVFEQASENNFKFLYDEEMGYEALDTDVLFTFRNEVLIPVPLKELMLIAWYESDNTLNMKEESSKNFYLHLPSQEIIQMEMYYLDGYCIASYCHMPPDQISKSVRANSLHFIDYSFFRNITINKLFQDDE